MPRTARLDALGCVQHVTARGIERRAIFRDDRDRLRFLDLLEGIMRESAAVALAWALMPNHFHMIVRTHGDPLSRVMARLNTAYAVGFNLRHDRAGHLFQNRYHSKPIEGGSRSVHPTPPKQGASSTHALYSGQLPSGSRLPKPAGQSPHA